MLWLGIHFPLLPLEIFTASCGSDLPQQNSPQVVTENGRVMLRNSTAATAGIAPGSTLATAHSIAPQLEHYQRSPEREYQRLTLLAESLYGFSPRVSLLPPSAGGWTAGEALPGIVVEIGGSLRLFGDAEALTRQVAALCHNLGHTVRLCRAQTPLAALILARADAHHLDTVPLPLAAVEPRRLSTERLERLGNMGVHTLQQLLALPREGLARRFGTDLVDYLARLTGDQPDPRPLIEPAQRFRAALHLLDPLNDKAALDIPMQRLLNDLQHWLVARQLASGQLRWHFIASGGRQRRRVCLPVRFARAQQNRAAFLDITRLALNDTALPADVMDIVLEARRLEPWSAGSRGLFNNLRDAPASSAGPGEVSVLVDQLRARLGSQACYSLTAVDQHTPEQAWQPAVPLGRSAAAADAAAVRERPLWLLDPPRAIRPEQLSLLRGPERIHTGWWSPSGERALALRAPSRTSFGRSHREEGSHTEESSSRGEARDYYVARHRGGAVCWVFIDPRERWFLHGYFS